MLLLAIDTSGRHGSVALCRGDAGSFELLQMTALEGGTYSARLMPAIAEMLQQHGISKNQLDAFAVVSGPGSFTGLRVGLATVKALSEVLHKPLVTVSMLEALAILRGPESARVTALLDAGRGEVFAAEFEIKAGAAKMIWERVAKLDAFVGELAASKEPAVTSADILTPDAKVAEAPHIAAVSPVHADEIGRIGLRKLLAGEIADAESLDANYIRRSDAEIFAPPKR